MFFLFSIKIDLLPFYNLLNIINQKPCNNFEIIKIMNSKSRNKSLKVTLQRVNPEFIGIAKTVDIYRRQRKVYQSQRQRLNHQYLHMQRINEQLDKQMKKKKFQLRSVQQIRDRYMQQVKQKQQLNALKQLEIAKNHSRALQTKQKARIKIQKAKEHIYQKKKSISEMIKHELTQMKHEKSQKGVQIMELKHSRVKAIEQQKRKNHDSIIKYFQQKNKKCVQNYSNMMQNQIASTNKYKNDLLELQNKLLALKDKANRKKNSVEKLQQSLENLRSEGSRSGSRIINRSRVISNRSKSPSSTFLTREFTSLTKAKIQNPQSL